MHDRKFYVSTKALFFNDKNEVLILKVSQEDLKGDTPIHWDLPGGRIKKGYDIKNSLKNEIEEELGVVPDNINILRVFDLGISNIDIPSDEGNIGSFLVIYLCKFKKQPAIKLNFEHTEYKWTSTEEAAELLKYKEPSVTASL